VHRKFYSTEGNTDDTENTDFRGFILAGNLTTLIQQTNQWKSVSSALFAFLSDGNTDETENTDSRGFIPAGNGNGV